MKRSHCSSPSCRRLPPATNRVPPTCCSGPRSRDPVTSNAVCRFWRRLPHEPKRATSIARCEPRSRTHERSRIGLGGSSTTAERLARIAEGAGADSISVRATQLRAFIALSQQRFGEALALFNLTYDAYWRCRERDADLAEMIVHQIAGLEIVLRSRTVHGTHAVADRRRVRDPWDTTPDLPSVTRLKTFGVDAWLFALDGDRDTAFRKIRQAEEMAREAAWRVWALAGRASLAAAFGEIGSAREHAAFATELSRGVEWGKTA